MGSFTSKPTNIEKHIDFSFDSKYEIIKYVTSVVMLEEREAELLVKYNDKKVFEDCKDVKVRYWYNGEACIITLEMYLTITMYDTHPTTALIKSGNAELLVKWLNSHNAVVSPLQAKWLKADCDVVDACPHVLVQDHGKYIKLKDYV